jgi:elongation factor Ts
MLDNIAKGKLARFFKDNLGKPRLYQRQQIKRCKLRKVFRQDLIVTGFKRAALDNSFYF